MSRSIRFILVATVLFLLFYFSVHQFLFPSSETTVTEVVEPKVDIYVLDNSAEKNQIVQEQMLSVQSYTKAELKGRSYSPVQDFTLSPKTRFTRNISNGSYLTVSDVINPDHDDYIFYALNKGELPYWYDVTELINNKALVVKSGDYVSFILIPRTSFLTSKLIVKQARVLKLTELSSLTGSQNAPFSYQLVLALTLNDILKLEKIRQSKTDALEIVLTTNINKQNDSVSEVYALNKQVLRGQTIRQEDLTVRRLDPIGVSQDYTEISELMLLPGAVYKGGYEAGTVLTTNMVANTDDSDYPLQFLKGGELPYWVDVTTLVNQGGFTAKRGNTVSFILRYQPEGTAVVVSKIIADQVKVLHLKAHQSLQGIVTYNLIVALETSQILKLETAKKTGELIVMLSSNLTINGENRGSFSSKEFTDKKIRTIKVKALRGQGE
ncbi:hypothetical protein [Vibrio sp. SCSIO 43137]|uniref:hypothetical protein n=1 Tax=Vibrio sp. SCSIO 43137 TaxID=3021011 RepID=UPI002306EDB3|nr:hypothetical protein [Vibrio sp. SCSIO 43137]WCE32555.1 hypothetical protein PK654_18880 [Vibrio sp. SCSIO 43137]